MNNLISLLIYLLAFGVSILGAYQYSKDKSTYSFGRKVLYYVFITFPIIFIQGLRYDVGTDYLSYVDLVYGFNNNNNLYLSWYRNEPLFILLGRLSYELSNKSVWGFFLVDAVLMNTILFRTVDYYKNEISVTWLYFAYYMLCFPYFLNAERQGLAVAIIWMSTIYIREKKYVKFLICVLIALLLHNTAIAGLLFLVIEYMKNKNKILHVFFLSGLACMPFAFGAIINFLGNRFLIFSKYTKFITNGESSSSNVNFIFMFFLSIILFVVLHRYYGTKLDKFGVLSLVVLQVSSFLLNIYIDWGFRMSYYFQIGMMYAYAYALPRIKNRLTRYLFIMIYVVSLLFYFIYKFYIQGNCEIFPYRFI